MARTNEQFFGLRNSGCGLRDIALDWYIRLSFLSKSHLIDFSDMQKTMPCSEPASHHSAHCKAESTVETFRLARYMYNNVKVRFQGCEIWSSAHCHPKFTCVANSAPELLELEPVKSEETVPLCQVCDRCGRPCAHNQKADWAETGVSVLSRACRPMPKARSNWKSHGPIHQHFRMGDGAGLRV